MTFFCKWQFFLFPFFHLTVFVFRRLDCFLFSFLFSSLFHERTSFFCLTHAPMPRSRAADTAARRDVRETSVTAAFPPHFFARAHVARGELAVDLTTLARTLDLGGSAGGRGLRTYLDALVTQHVTAVGSGNASAPGLPTEDVVTTETAPLLAPCCANESAALHAVVRCFAGGMVPYPKPVNVLDIAALIQRQRTLATARQAAAAAAAASRSPASRVSIASLVDPAGSASSTGSTGNNSEDHCDEDDNDVAELLLLDAKRGRLEEEAPAAATTVLTTEAVGTATATGPISTEELNVARLLSVVRSVRAAYGLPAQPPAGAEARDMHFGVTLVDYVRGGRRSRHQELFVVCREARGGGTPARGPRLPLLSFYSRFVELAERASFAAAAMAPKAAGGVADGASTGTSSSASATLATLSSGAQYRMQKHEENAWFVCAVLDLREQPLCRAVIEATALQYPELAVSLDPLRVLDEYRRYLLRDRAPPRAPWTRSAAQQQRRHKERVRAEVSRLRQLHLQQQQEGGLSPCTVTPSSCASPYTSPSITPTSAAVTPVPVAAATDPVAPPPAPLLLCLAQQTVDTAEHDDLQP